MHEALDSGTVQDRRVGLHIDDRSLAPRVLEALDRLGYALTCETELEAARVRIVDVRCLDTLPDAEQAPDLQLLLIGSTREQCLDDPRVRDATDRPGRLSAVYAMIQRALEDTPRRTPRVGTRLSARCIRSDRRSIGAILSLSEGGCLLRSRERLKRGARMALQFALPDYGLISTRVECRYARGEDAGLVFTDPDPDVRHTIAHYVTMQLACEPAAALGPRSA